MRGGLKAFAQPNRIRRVGSLPGMKETNDRYERDTTRQACRQNPVAQEDGDLNRQTELQSRPHQGSGGRKEADAWPGREDLREILGSAGTIPGDANRRINDANRESRRRPP